MSWTDAKIYCESLGGHLVTITSQVEQDFVTNLIVSGTKPYYWAGGMQLPGSSEPFGGWTWVTGEPFSYTNWRSYQPDNCTNDDKIFVIKNIDWFGSTSPGKWVDDFNTGCFSTVSYGFICEWEFPTPSEKMYISDMTWINSTSGYNYPPKKDTNNGGGPLIANGITYFKGIGTHPFSGNTNADVTVNISGLGYTRFQAIAGNVGFNGTTTYTVLVDNQIKEASPIITGNAIYVFDVDITNGNMLTLRVNDGGDGMDCDGTNWCDAKLIGNVNNSLNIASKGSIIATVMNPIGTGNRNIEVIRDGFKPVVNSSASSIQYDTYLGSTSDHDEYIGYIFSDKYIFTNVIFQEGKHFNDGGWFLNRTLKLQAKIDGNWIDIDSNVTPGYPDTNNINFFLPSYETYTFTFNSVVADGIRIIGSAGGSSRFISVG
ncbi:MAG: hypothetical protein ACD_19C00349G0001, partial [uncultured bacterium]